MQTYLFYDIETTGLNKAFDQVLQFAAIRTDLNLKELERHEINVKLNPDTVPSPQALLTHHIGIAETQTGLSEYQAMQEIHQLFNTPETISIGYNTLGFDDEFLRFSFYRNLLPPYTHQYAKQCARADLYPMAILYHLYKNDIVQWPQLNGETKLKLELINNANQLVQGRAHHAMTDVEITLMLAKRFFQARDIWDFTLSYFNKQTDQARTLELPHALTSNNGQHPEGLMILGKIGATHFFQAPVLGLGNHDFYKNQTAWLRLDTLNLNQTTENTIPENTWVIRKKWGEPGFILPSKERFLKYLSPERKALAVANKLWLQQHPDIFQKIIAYHRQFVYPVLPDTDQDASLYHHGFWSNEEIAICQRFHQLPPKEKATFVSTLKNPQLKSLAIRLLGRNYPEALTPEQQQEFAQYMQRATTAVITDYKGDARRRAGETLAEILALEKSADIDQTATGLLTELKYYLQINFT